MIALAVLALQAAAPTPLPPPIEALPVAAAGLATRVTFDTAGAITGCTTAVHGLAGPIDGCLLFAKPALLARFLGRETAGLGWATVRLDGTPEGAPPPAVGNRRLLAEATVTIAADGTIAHCARTARPSGSVAIDLCALMPRGAGFFTPAPGQAGLHTFVVSFAVDSGAR